MACGKPPKPGDMTPPRKLRHPSTQPTRSRMGGEVGAATKDVLDKFSQQSAKRTAPTIIQALENNNHWGSKEYKEQLIKMVEGSGKIPSEYKNQLPKDVADVLRACPNAAGLVKELSLRGQRGATGSKSKLGSGGNSAIGSAYELMGTAALTRKGSTASNGGPKLRINSGSDIVTFGDKANINRQIKGAGTSAAIDMPTRKTIENDIRIWKEGREIGVDFKHTQEKRYSSEEHENQVENVVKALQQGHIHEYHFVTNGQFGKSFKEVIDSANETLMAEDQEIISYHEYVKTVG